MWFRCAWSPIACSSGGATWSNLLPGDKLSHAARVVPLVGEGERMSLAATDELERTDEAFARNRLLSTFPADARALIEPDCSVVDLELGAVLHSSGDDVVTSYFPFGPTMISLGIELADGRSVEVASVGQEGAVGGI